METVRAFNIVPDDDNAMSLDELRQGLKACQQRGDTFAHISEQTGVHRSTISQLVNQGITTRIESLTALQTYVTKKQEQTTETHYAQRLELWQHDEYIKAMGWCNHVIQNRKMGVIIGAPGTGKTTILHGVMEMVPSCIYLEAMSNMRVGDLVNTIARMAGISLKGNGYQRFQLLVAALKNRTDIIILIDEAEYLKKWDVDKFEYLRKIWDNTGTPVIMCGTAELETILTRGTGRENLAQLYRRKYELQLKGMSPDNALSILRQYHCTTDAAIMLSKICADVAHGGLGTMCEILDMCLKTADGGCITVEMVTAAKKYKMMF